MTNSTKNTNYHLVLHYLNSNLFTGPFVFGLFHETPPNWNPLHDYSLIFGFWKHSDITKILEDASLPFSTFEKFPILTNEWYNTRAEILVQEIMSVIGAFQVKENRNPKEWFEIYSSKLQPLVYNRFIFLRLLRALFYYGLDQKRSIQDNFFFLYQKCSLMQYDQHVSDDFLSNIYNRCKMKEPSLFFPLINANPFDTSWISDQSITILCKSLVLLQSVREMSGLSEDYLLMRIDCCPPWNAGMKLWDPKKDLFLFQIVSEYGFSTLIELFVNPKSTLIQDDNIKESLKSLRRIEDLQVSPSTTVSNMMYYKFLFKHSARVDRITQLVNFMKYPNCENHLFKISKNSLMIVSPGYINAFSTPLGYFALKTLLNKNKTFVIACSVGGSLSQPIYQIKVLGEKNIKVNNFDIEKVMETFRNEISKDSDFPTIPNTIKGEVFFGFKNPITSEILS